MISVKDQQKVFHLKWFKKLYQGVEKHNLAHYFLDNLGGTNYLLHCNAAIDENFIRNNIKSLFWADVIKTWFSLAGSILNGPVTTVEILSQPLFLNSNIKYKNKPLYVKPFVSGKVLFVVDLLQHKQLMNMNEIKQKINIYPALIFDYNAISNSLSNKWKLQLKDVDTHEIQEAQSRILNIPENIVQLLKKAMVN